MANKYGILIGDRHVTYTNAVSVDQLVPVFIRSVIEKLEGTKIPSGSLAQAVQTYLNEYAEASIENQINDYGEVNPSFTICPYEIADHLCNQGWITINRSSLKKATQLKMVHDWMKRKGIKDYTI